MYASRSLIAAVLLFAFIIEDVRGSIKRKTALDNFCAACDEGKVTFTPEENTRADKTACEIRERKRLLSSWYTNKFSITKKIRSNDLLEIITTGATRFCQREWSNLQCKKHCAVQALPNKVECKRTFRYRDLPDRTVFLCSRHFDLRSVSCIENKKNSYEFVANKCNFCQKLFNDNELNSVQQVPVKECCNKLQICKRRFISRQWSMYAPICDC